MDACHSLMPAAAPASVGFCNELMGRIWSSRGAITPGPAWAQCKPATARMRSGGIADGAQRGHNMEAVTAKQIHFTIATLIAISVHQQCESSSDRSLWATNDCVESAPCMDSELSDEHDNVSLHPQELMPSAPRVVNERPAADVIVS